MTDVAALEARIAELEDLLGIAPEIPKALPISPIQWQLLQLLLKRPLVAREFAFRAIWGGKPESEQPAGDRIVDVHVSRLNRVLKQILDVEVATDPGTGYYLTGLARDKIKAQIERFNKEVTESIDGRYERSDHRE